MDTDLSTVTAAADRAFLVRAEEPYVSHIEFVSSMDPDFERNFLLYHARYAARTRRTVESAVILLRPFARHRRLNGIFTLPGVGRPVNVEFMYSVLRVWEEPAETFLTGGLTLLLLAPIAKLDRREIPKVLQRLESRLEAEATPRESASLITATSILLGLKYDQDFIGNLLRKDIMKGSWVYQEIIDEGKAEGALSQARETLLRLGRRRFGEPSAELNQQLAEETNLDRLNELLDRIMSVESWDDLFRE